MTKKPTRNEIHAEKIGQAVAQNMFKTMLKPSNQGENFSWDRFPEIFADMAETQAFLGFKDGVKNFDNLKAITVSAYLEEGKKVKEEYQRNDILPIRTINSPKLK